MAVNEISTHETHSTAGRATQWQLRTRTLLFEELPMLMGIVNVTPDSFSDGGQYYTRQSAVDHALRLEDAGAMIIDIGGESTRPYSQPVSEAEELERIVPILESLQDRVAAAISIDTSKASVAAAAIALGAEIINDVTGLEGDVRMLELAAQSGVGVCAMHMQGTPQTMQDHPSYGNIVEEIEQYLAARDRALLAGGIAPHRICLDPGIGFGKTHEHNWALLRGCAHMHHLGRPLLVGHSRKGFVRKLTRPWIPAAPPSASLSLSLPPSNVDVSTSAKANLRSTSAGDLVAGSVGVALALARSGVQVLRVHDVQATRDALLCFAASGGLS